MKHAFLLPVKLFPQSLFLNHALPNIFNHSVCFEISCKYLIARNLKISHDLSSEYMADEFQDEIAFLGMTGLPSFVY
jgi:hypothetical protein